MALNGVLVAGQCMADLVDASARLCSALTGVTAAQVTHCVGGVIYGAPPRMGFQLVSQGAGGYTSVYTEVPVPACDLELWSGNPWNLSTADASEISFGIIGVWLVALLTRALIRALQVGDIAHDEREF